MEEEWKPVKGYEGLYEVSNMGRVMTLQHSQQRVLKGGKDDSGYHIVGSTKNGKFTIKRVHILVAEAFVPKPKNWFKIIHIDGVKNNNTVSNLMWTIKDNNVHYTVDYKEEWRPIKEYDGLYDISNIGRVRSYKRNKVEIISPMNTSTGYKQVEFAKDGISKRKLVHRLVAEVFIPNPMNLPVVNHLDGDKTNNCVTNLEWCTYRQNTLHAIKIGLTRFKLPSKPIMVYKGGKFIGTFKSIGECANKLNCDKTNISGVIHGRHKTHHGFSFKLVNSDDLSRGDGCDYAIKVVAIKGAKIIKAKSCRELAKQLGVSSSSVCHTLKTGMKIKGYTIKKVE